MKGCVLAKVFIFLCCPLLFVVNANSQVVQGYIDSKNGDTFASWTNPNLIISGWAAATDDGAPAASVQILIDGKLVGTVKPSAARTDIANYLGAAYLNCGWSFTYSVGTKFTPGLHTMAAIGYDAEGNGVPLNLYNLSANITIPTPQPPQGYLDGLTPTSVTQAQSFTVSGWAGDPQDGSPVVKVQILLDGTSIGYATLGGSRPDVANAYGSTYLKSGWTFTYTPSRYFGPHTLTAVAFDNEGLSTTLNLYIANTINVLAPDLIESAVTIGGSPTAGGTIQVNDTTTNQGSATANASTTNFYLNTTAVKGGTLLGSRAIPSLVASGSSTPTTPPSFTLPTNITGTYYVIACANAGFNLIENTANDCLASSSFTIGGADLVESDVSIVGGTKIPGGSIQVSDTTSNQGTGTAGASTTNFYLNTMPVKGGTLLGSRSVPSLQSNGNSGPVTSTFNLPASLAGVYYVVACSNATFNVVETNSTNNCKSSDGVVGADLRETGLSTDQTAVAAGSSIVVTDTVTDFLSDAGTSTTRYYLSPSLTLAKTSAMLLGSKNIPALLVNGFSTQSITPSIPSSTSPGNYYVFACANDPVTLYESNTSNNCRATPLVIYVDANVLHVDQLNANAADASCGTSAIPCKTISEGLAAAKPGNTVLVEQGSYVEQLNILQNVTLVSHLPLGAVVQAPATLTPDSASLFNIVEVGGAATSVNLFGLKIAGPGPSSCGSIHYGIFVGNANATIAGNEIDSVRDSTYSGCQNGVGIRFGFRSLGLVGHNGTIAYNTVQDYQKGGIVVDGDGTYVNVTGNIVYGQGKLGINGQNGIQISRGAAGIVDNNYTTNNHYASTPRTQSAAGILVYNITGGVTITNNASTFNDEGIGIYSDATAGTNVTVKNNYANINSVMGIHVDANSSGNTIWSNFARGNTTYDAADEHPDLTSNDWGVGKSYQNVLGPKGINVGLFTF